MNDGLQLLQRARRWDEAALTEIYDTFAPKIFRYVYRRTGNDDVAHDLTAETFHRFLEALKREAGPTEHLSGWLYRVAHNLIVDFYRREPDDPPAQLEDVDPAVPATQGEHVAREQRASRTRAALMMLTPLQQQVVVLRFLEEMSLAEVAEVLNRTVGSIKALQHRAIDNLQQILAEGQGSEEKDGT
ncbi:MAG: RNA polymerase sigma factor [Anaerolineae bacterium]